MQIAPDVYQLGDRLSKFYLCAEPDGLTLIDTGSWQAHRTVFDAIKKIGRSPSDLAHIFITHADVDHAGSAAAIHAGTGAKVYASSPTASLLIKGRSPPHMPSLVYVLLNLFWRYRPVPETAIHTIKDGDVLPILEGLHVLSTPGHTHDHHSFFNPKTGVLFAGDALNTRGGRLQSSPKRITFDEAVAQQSAIRLLELAPAVFACGHGRPMSNYNSEDLMKFFRELRGS